MYGMHIVYNKHFPTPKFLSMQSFAFDISDQSIKYGRLAHTKSGPRLVKYGKITIPKGVVSSGNIENPQELIKILTRLSKEVGIEFVRVALPEEQIYLFTLVLPKIPWKELKESILLQIEEHIPLKANETIFDFDLIEERDKDVLIQVVATSASLIDDYLSVFTQAKLTPITFELEAQAIARAVIPNDNKEVIMVVDFGGTRTGISIVSKGKVLFTATVDVGGVMFTSMIAKSFDISFEDAEKMKNLYSISNHAEGTKIFSSILNGISVLHDEIGKHLSFWNTHTDDYGRANEKVKKIIMCGGDANLKGVAEYLEASFKIKVEHANAWTNVFSLNEDVPDIDFGDSLGFVTVIGLALNDFLNE